ncbi:MAG: POTRA domain-containing protein [Planctomycetota bacterium]
MNQSRRAGRLLDRCTSRQSGTLSASLRVVVRVALLIALFGTPCLAQMGGMGGMGGGMGGPQGGGGPAPSERAKFRDHIHARSELPIARERGDKLVRSVEIVGNRKLSDHVILQQLQTKKGRFYSREILLADVHRLNEMRSFDRVTFDTDENQAGVAVRFIVTERPLITRVVYHGSRAVNKRDLKGRSGIEVGDPLSQFSIESARRRLIDYYKEEGFGQVAISTILGLNKDPGVVIFRINEGPKERIDKIKIIGNTILSSARLKKIIKSRGALVGIYKYAFNTADQTKINQDEKILERHYHNLGYLTANVGRFVEYDESGKFMDLTFVIQEGKRYKINSIQIVGNQFVTEQSLRNRLTLKPGDMFDGGKLQKDVGELIYGYGELGFIYAEVQPQTIMRDAEGVVDLVYRIEEGDQWKIGEIRVNIEGEPHLMRESVILNMLELQEGQLINRRSLEIGRRRMGNSQLLETNPQIAEPPDIIVEPREDAY